MKKSILILTVVFLCIFGNTFASENYDTCTFSFESHDAETNWELSFIRLSIDVNNPKQMIHENLCSFSPNSTFIISDRKSENQSLRWVGITLKGCTFDYGYGIVKNQFITESNYNDSCREPKKNGKSVNHAKPKIISMKDGYHIECKQQGKWVGYHPEYTSQKYAAGGQWFSTLDEAVTFLCQ